MHVIGRTALIRKRMLYPNGANPLSPRALTAANPAADRTWPRSSRSATTCCTLLTQAGAAGEDALSALCSAWDWAFVVLTELVSDLEVRLQLTWQSQSESDLAAP